MKPIHLYNRDRSEIPQFIEHAKARIEHFKSIGSKSGVQYWKQRLDAFQTAQNKAF